MGIDIQVRREPSSVRSPDHIVYGFGAIDELGRYVTARDIDSTLLVTDERLARGGVVDPVVEALEDADVAVGVFDGVVPEPPLSVPRDAADELRRGGQDLVVGCGGGSTLDTAKLAAVLATHDVSIRDVLGMGNVPGAGVPVALLPTTAGTGSEVTHIGVFSDPDEGGVKRVVYADPLFAELAILDPILTTSLPPNVAAATGLDALTHAIEAYVTLLRTPYTDMLARRAIELIGANLRAAVHQGARNDRARYEMLFAAMLAGQAFVNSGLGAVHALTYPLSVEYKLGHGEANAMLLPHVMRYNVPAEQERFAEIARLLGVAEVDARSPEARALAAVEAVTDLIADVGIEPSIGHLGEMEPEDLERYAEITFEYSKHNIDRNPRHLEREDVVEIFRMAR